MTKKIKKIWNAVTSVLIGLMILLAALLWGFQLLGYQVLVVQSPSMEPDYGVGSLVYVKPVDPEQLQVGDVITFQLGGGVRGTHRIIEVLNEDGSLSFRTKGDANEEADNNPVLPENILGQVKFTVPWLGFLVTYIQQPPGIYVAVSAAALLLLLTVLPDFIFSEDKEKNKQEETT